MFSKYTSALLTAFLVIAFVREPTTAGNIVATFGELLRLLFQELGNVINALV